MTTRSTLSFLTHRYKPEHAHLTLTTSTKYTYILICTAKPLKATYQMYMYTHISPLAGHPTHLHVRQSSAPNPASTSTPQTSSHTGAPLALPARPERIRINRLNEARPVPVSLHDDSLIIYISDVVMGEKINNK